MNVQGVTTMHLFTHKCKCGNVNIHGFWHQLEITPEITRRRVIVHMPCSECRLVYNKAYKLTSRKSYPRMINWTRVGLQLIDIVQKLVPGKYEFFIRRKVLSFILWADRRIVF